MPSDATAQPECLACGHELRLLGTRASFRYWTCHDCGLVQLWPLPSEEVLARAYAGEYHAAGHYSASPEQHARTRSRVCAQVADIVTSLHAPGDARCVLEVGVGWGTLGELLHARGVPYMGIEPSQVMAAHAAAKGLDVRHCALESLDPDTVRDRVRCIAMMAVYEHMVDQEGTLRQLRKLLASDGALVIQCPTGGIPRVLGGVVARFRKDNALPSFFGSLAPPWHVCLPTPRSVQQQAARAGFVVTDIVPSLSGRERGLKGGLQVVNEVVALTGNRMVGQDWPFTMAHVFTLRCR